MLKRFFKYLDEVSEPTREQHSIPLDYIRVKVANRLIVTGFFIVSILVIFNSFMGFYAVAIVDLIILGILGVSFKLNRSNKEEIGVPLIIISLILLTFGAMFLMPHLPNGSFILVGLVGLPFIMIKKRLKTLRYLSIILCIGFYIYAEFFLIRPKILSTNDALIAGIFMVLIVFSLIIFQYKYWESSNLKSSAKLLEQQILLNETNQLSNLGVISAGIAHEINNPLTIIQGHNHRLKRLTNNAPAEISEKMNMSLMKQKEALKRISGIVQGLKTLSRDGRNDKMIPEGLNSIILECLGLCQENAKSKSIELSYIPSLKDCNLLCQRVQIGQVILNLMSNAIDEAIDNSEPWIRISTSMNEGVASIYFKNSGELIDDKITKKIFTPFFTTKELGKGTGLGLPISNKIMEKHGGTLKLDQSSGHICFILEIPIYKNDTNFNSIKDDIKRAI